LTPRKRVIADANHARCYLRARMNSADRSRQEQQVSHLIKREGELAYHDDKRNRKEIDAVIHRRVTRELKKDYAESKACYVHRRFANMSQR
jgi:predicted AAA+ superfamily ATPase